MAKSKKPNNVLKFLIIGIGVAIICIGGAFAFYYKDHSGQTLIISENQQDISVKTGQEFAITLASNPSTGYIWTASNSYSQGVINQTESSTAVVKSGAPGTPTTQTLTFKGKSAGTTTLVLNYSRPWEIDKPPINTKQFNVIVK